MRCSGHWPRQLRQSSGRAPAEDGWAHAAGSVPLGCQWAGQDGHRIRYELLDPERDRAGALLINRGLLALPVGLGVVRGECPARRSFRRLGR